MDMRLLHIYVKPNFHPQPGARTMIRFFPNFMALDVKEWGLIPKG